MKLNSIILVNLISFITVHVTALKNAKPVTEDVGAELVVIDTGGKEPLSTGILISPGYVLFSTHTFTDAPKDTQQFRVIRGSNKLRRDTAGQRTTLRHGDSTADKMKIARVLTYIDAMNDSVVLADTINPRSGRSVAAEVDVDPIGPLRKLLKSTYTEWPMDTKFWIIGWQKEASELTKSYIVVTVVSLDECQAEDVGKKILLCTKASSADDLSAIDVGAGVTTAEAPHKLIGLVLTTHKEFALVEDTSFIVSEIEMLFKADVSRRASMRKRSSGDMIGIAQKIHIAGISLSLRNYLALKI